MSKEKKQGLSPPMHVVMIPEHQWDKIVSLVSENPKLADRLDRLRVEVIRIFIPKKDT